MQGILGRLSQYVVFSVIFIVLFTKYDSVRYLKLSYFDGASIQKKKNEELLFIEGNLSVHVKNDFLFTIYL